MVGLKVMQQAALAAIGQDLVVHVEEYLGRQDLHLEICLIVDAVRARQGGAVFASQPIVEQPPPFRQAVVRGRHFREMKIAKIPRNHVPSAGNAHCHLAIFPLDFSNRQDVEELWVERTPIKLKHQIANARSQGEGVHGPWCFWAGG